MSRASPRFHRNNPPLPAAVASVFLVNVRGTVDNQQWVVNLGYMYRAGNILDATSEFDLLTAFITAIQAPFLACMAADSFLVDYKCTCVSVNTRNPVVRAPVASPLAGTIAGNHLDTELAVVLSKTSASRGQHGRGRIYMPGVPTGALIPATDANRLTGGALLFYGNLAAALQTPLNDGGDLIDPCVYTRTHGGSVVTNAAIVTAFTTRALLGTVRRRRIGRGK